MVGNPTTGSHARRSRKSRPTSPALLMRELLDHLETWVRELRALATSPTESRVSDEEAEHDDASAVKQEGKARRSKAGSKAAAKGKASGTRRRKLPRINLNESLIQQRVSDLARAVLENPNDQMAQALVEFLNTAKASLTEIMGLDKLLLQSEKSLGDDVITYFHQISTQAMSAAIDGLSDLGLRISIESPVGTFTRKHWFGPWGTFIKTLFDLLDDVISLDWDRTENMRCIEGKALASKHTGALCIGSLLERHLPWRVRYNACSTLTAVCRTPRDGSDARKVMQNLHLQSLYRLALGMSASTLPTTVAPLPAFDLQFIVLELVHRLLPARSEDRQQKLDSMEVAASENSLKLIDGLIHLRSSDFDRQLRKLLNEVNLNKHAASANQGDYPAWAAVRNLYVIEGEDSLNLEERPERNCEMFIDFNVDGLSFHFDPETDQDSPIDFHVPFSAIRRVDLQPWSQEITVSISSGVMKSLFAPDRQCGHTAIRFCLLDERSLSVMERSLTFHAPKSAATRTAPSTPGSVQRTTASTPLSAAYANQALATGKSEETLEGEREHRSIAAEPVPTSGSRPSIQHRAVAYLHAGDSSSARRVSAPLTDSPRPVAMRQEGIPLQEEAGGVSRPVTPFLESNDPSILEVTSSTTNRVQRLSPVPEALPESEPVPLNAAEKKQFETPYRRSPIFAGQAPGLLEAGERLKLADGSSPSAPVTVTSRRTKQGSAEGTTGSKLIDFEALAHDVDRPATLLGPSTNANRVWLPEAHDRRTSSHSRRMGGSERKLGESERKMGEPERQISRPELKAPSQRSGIAAAPTIRDFAIGAVSVPSQQENRRPEDKPTLVYLVDLFVHLGNTLAAFAREQDRDVADRLERACGDMVQRVQPHRQALPQPHPPELTTSVRRMENGSMGTADGNAQTPQPMDMISDATSALEKALTVLRQVQNLPQVQGS